MTTRSKIPADAVRELILESGHRCAVCGQPLTLELAHIIPWRESRDNSPDNLICLCANCHTRSDREKWGVEILRQYKKRPWINSRPAGTAGRAKNRKSIEIKIDLELVKLPDEKRREWLEKAIAAFLNVSPKEVRIKSIEED
jgi:type I restriction enzyme R subunit